MKMSNEFLKFHSSCICVKGAARAIICDLQRCDYAFIPNDLFDLLPEFENNSIAAIQDKYDIENKRTITEYLDFLLSKEFCFICTKDELSWFPKLQLHYETPYVVNNCIIDANETSNHNWTEIVSQLTSLFCCDVQIRFFCKFDLKELKMIISLLESSSIKNIEFIVSYNETIDLEQLVNFCDSSNRVTQLIIHSSPSNKNEKSKNGKCILFIKQKITDSSHCGIINPAFFAINIQSFSESIAYNSCLNKKISIDQNGEIKNCPSMTKNYGNIKNTTLNKALEKQGFKDIWSITKDKIAICKDCEFRYICTDCRAYLQDPEDIYSKPLKCGYDPYTGKWEEWSTNPLSKKGIEYYGLQELVKPEK